MIQYVNVTCGSVLGAGQVQYNHKTPGNWIAKRRQLGYEQTGAVKVNSHGVRSHFL
jgi:hypothetical protein